MSKKTFGIGLLIICLIFVGAVHFFNNDNENEDFYLKTVVYKDSDDTLVPVSLNFYNEMDIEEEIINRIDMMKSDEFTDLGLYPVLSENLKINHIDLVDKTLTLDLNDELYANGDALDILEALTYTICDYDEVDILKLQINGEEISSLPNSDITVSSLTYDIGLNNFDETTTHIHHTYPVMVYSTKTIKNQTYYVPTTTRMDESLSLKEQIQIILTSIDSSIICNDVNLSDQILSVTLDSSILLEDGTIDKTLLDLMNLSLMSVEGVEKVSFIVDNEVIENEDVSSIYINYLKN